jgi:hypothetical protein
VNQVLAYPEWTSTPAKVALVWCLFDLCLFVALWIGGDRAAGGVLLEVGGWLAISLVVPRVLTGPVSIPKYLGTVTVLALVEETLAYSTGGGLHGSATSLWEDWVRAVPTFFGLGVGLFLCVRTTGLTPGESFMGTAVAGILIEVGLGAGFNPIALLAVGGAAAWVYGTILSLPLTRTPKPPAPLWRKVGALVVFLAAGAFGFGLLGLELQAVLHL